EIRRVRSFSLALAAALTAIGVVGAALISRRVTRPLAQLGETIQAFGSSGEPIPLGPHDGGSEIEHVAESFRTMVAERNQIERNLRESRRMLEIVLDAIPVRVFWKDLGSVYLGCNRRFAADAGLSSPAELIGRNDFDLAWHEQAELYRADDAEVMSSGRPMINYEEPQTAPGGRRLWLRTSKVPLTTDDGTVIGVLGTYEDITEAKASREALERSEQRFALAQQAGGIGTWEWEIESGRVYWSSAAEAMFGYPPGGFDGTLDGYLSRIHPDDLERVRATIDHSVETGEDFALEQRVMHPDVGVRVIAARGRVTRDESDHVRGMLGIVQDVTERLEAEAALRRSERQLAEAQALAHLGSWEVDLRTGETIWSAEQYRLLGYEPFSVEPKDRNFYRRVHPDDRDALRAEFERSRSERGETFSVEHRVRLPDGNERTVYQRAQLIRDAQGVLIRMLGTTLDVSSLRKVQQALLETETRLHSVITSAPIILFAIDTDGVFRVSEGQGLKGLNLHPDEVVGMSVFELYGEYEDIITDIKLALSGEAFRSYSELGTLRYDVHYRPWHDAAGHLLGTIGVAVDDTERAQAQQALSEYREHLEDLVEDRTEALRAVNEELEAFSYSVSHDLRTPLRAIDGFSQALIEDYAADLDETALDYLARVRGAAQRMGELIDDLLQLSRVTRHELHFEPVNLSAEAEAVVAELRAAEPEREIDIRIRETPPVEGDKRLLRVLLANLIGNAWKFTGRTEGARIELDYNHTDGEDVYAVRDNGAGFDMRYADKLFGAFQRLHRSDEFEGTGIGLATVRRVLNRHGGRVWAEGAPGEGATFYFTLPGERRSNQRKRSGSTGG
ncbi:MAG: PAS domain-containing protein, partial [Chromatiales bacterium]